LKVLVPALRINPEHTARIKNYCLKASENAIRISRIQDESLLLEIKPEATE
jgi:hypothetical protein